MYRPIKKQYSTNIGISKRGVAIVILLISIIIGLRIYLIKDSGERNIGNYNGDLNLNLEKQKNNNKQAKQNSMYFK